MSTRKSWAEIEEDSEHPQQTSDNHHMKQNIDGDHKKETISDDQKQQTIDDNHMQQAIETFVNNKHITNSVHNNISHKSTGPIMSIVIPRQPADMSQLGNSVLDSPTRLRSRSLDMVVPPRETNQHALTTAHHYKTTTNADGNNLDASQPIYLGSAYHLYFDEGIKTGAHDHDFRQSLLRTRISEFNTVQSFWGYMNMFESQLAHKQYFNLRLFHSSILPIWEEADNAQGGKWNVAIQNRAERNLVWQDLAMALIGEQWATTGNGGKVTGIVLTARPRGDIVQVWVNSPQALSQQAIQQVLSDDHHQLSITYQSHDQHHQKQFSEPHQHHKQLHQVRQSQHYKQPNTFPESNYKRSQQHKQSYQSQQRKQPQQHKNSNPKQNNSANEHHSHNDSNYQNVTITAPDTRGPQESTSSTPQSCTTTSVETNKQPQDALSEECEQLSIPHSSTIDSSESVTPVTPIANTITSVSYGDNPASFEDDHHTSTSYEDNHHTSTPYKNNHHISVSSPPPPRSQHRQKTVLDSNLPPQVSSSATPLLLPSPKRSSVRACTWILVVAFFMALASISGMLFVE